MKYFVYDKFDKELATIEVDENGVYDVQFKDDSFESFLNLKISEGIEVFNEKEKNGNFVIEKMKVLGGGKNIGYAILDFLRYNGYVVKIDAQEVKKEAESILLGLPDDEHKKEIFEMLPNLNYLEATLLLKELKNKNN